MKIEFLMYDKWAAEYNTGGKNVKKGGNFSAQIVDIQRDKTKGYEWNQS